MEKNQTIEIAQVANGYALRASGGWFNDDSNILNWNEAKANVYVFQTFYELTCFLEGHFSYRQKAVMVDSAPAAT